MKATEERAMNYATIQCKGCRNEEKKGRYQGYIAGANEQKAIDIDKACEFLEKAIPPYMDIIDDIIDRDGIIEQLRKAMEE